MRTKIDILQAAASGIIFTSFFAVIFSLVLNSCNGNEKVVNASTIQTEPKNDATTMSTNETDSQFLKEVAQVNVEEIELGKLAQNNGTTKEVKDLGRMMENDHSTALKELQGLAEKKNIQLTASLSDNGSADQRKLQDKKGKDFDREYCDMMVKGHMQTIDKFEKEISDAQDADIKTWASNTLPVLKMHLNHSTECQMKCEKTYAKKD